MFKIKIIVLVVLISCVILFAGGPSNQADFAPEQQQKVIKVATCYYTRQHHYRASQVGRRSGYYYAWSVACLSFE